MINNFLFWLSRKLNYPLISPRALQVPLTYRCNLNCKMCSITNLLPEEEELSCEQIFYIVDEAKNYGIKEVVLTGGEPFLREDIFTICSYIYEKGLKSIITTNGVLINECVAKNIAASQVSHIHFSLDGLEKTHDFLRGEGIFKEVISNIKVLDTIRKKSNFFSLGIACTVMDNNVKELLDLIVLGDNLGVDLINFQPLAADNTNFLSHNSSAFWLKPENIPVLEQEIAKIRKYKLKRITIYEEPRLELLIKYYQKKLTRKDWVCFGGFKTIFICYSQKEPLVYTCPDVCGSLDKISLKEAWQSKKAFKLRLHSRNCRSLCMQSCYSKESAQSLTNVVRN